jgi:transcriptional regulator with XRE-family HTH domain
MSFSNRLLTFKNGLTHKAFAKKLGVSDALLRKYINGSDPSLSKAMQIAERTGSSLTWLASGKEKKATIPHSADVEINLSTLEHAIVTVSHVDYEHKLNLTHEQKAKLIITSYEYIKSTQQSDNTLLDKTASERFIYHLSKMYIL